MPAKKVRKAPSEEPAEEEKKQEEDVVAVAAEPEKKEPTPSTTMPSSGTENNDASAVGNNSQPSDQQIREAIVAMVKSANLEEISIKKIRLELEEKFNCPMKEKKELIKQIVTESIGM